jgi:[protein-PII] uridylyltransferase
VRKLRGRTAPRTAILGDTDLDQCVRRRAAAAQLAGPGTPAASRIASAPPAYVLAHSSNDIVRHAQLLAPAPRADEVRAVVTPSVTPGEWCLDVAAQDRVGLLAGFTGVLALCGIDVVQAVLATWDDGGALQAFVVRSDPAPDAHTLEVAFATALQRPHPGVPLPDAQVAFADTPSGMYTACIVRAPDRPGLLHSVAAAIAACGGDVHAARVSTEHGTAVDYFDISDRDGHPLDGAAWRAITAAIARGPS